MQQLKQSYKLLFTNSQKFIQTFSKHPNTIVHRPIRVVYNQQKLSYEVRAMQRIPAHSTVFMVAASSCFTSNSLIGASQGEIMKVQQIFQSTKKQYDMVSNLERQELIKFLIQIYANLQQLSQEEMPLIDFSNDLKKYRQFPNLVNYLDYVSSFHFLNLIQAKEKLYDMVYEIVSDKFIKVAKNQEFKNLLGIVRSSMRKHDDIKFIAPIYSLMSLSYTPNAKVLGKYMPHLRNSFFCLQTIRQVQQNQSITLHYPSNYTNYELLQRYGRIEQNNPYNEYMVLLNMSIPEILMNGNIDLKQKYLKINNKSIKNVIKLNNDGKIKDEDLKLMRVLFSKQETFNFSQMQQSNKYDSDIICFVKDAVRVQSSRENQSKKQLKESETDVTIKNIKMLQENDKNIINKFLNSSS